MSATAPCYTREYLQQLSKHLQPTGLLSIRFSYVDYGKQPLEQLTQNLCHVFQDVMMLEVAPGEMVFLASPQSGKLKNSVVIQNLQLPQVSRLLSTVGWDWSIIMNLSLYDFETLQKFKPTMANTLWTGNGSFSHPLELVSWINKSTQVKSLLENNNNRLIAIHQNHPKKDDILHRLSDVTAREKLLYEHPDEPWAYRMICKDRLQKNTRSEIITVKGEGLQKKIHEDDQQRISYFETLGFLLKNQNPSLQDIRTLYNFKQPYDPIVSYFLHNEIARICARLEPSQKSEELKCRLHMIYYGSLSDRSVIDICRCLTLIHEMQPEEIDPVHRWEFSNALCEQMKTRWSARISGASVPPVIEISDLKESIAALRLVLDKFPEWGEAAGIPPQAVAGRIRMVEKLLLDPLGDYKLSKIRKLEEARKSASNPDTSDTPSTMESNLLGF